MNDFDKKATQKARETAEKGRQVAEEMVCGVEKSGSAAFDNIRNLNLGLIDAAQKNADAACALARDIATIKTPSDLLAVWMRHAQQVFDMATKQANYLIALGQKLATESATPMTRSLQQAFTQVLLSPIFPLPRHSDEVTRAAQIMQSKQIRRLPVIDKNKHMVGILSLGDLSHAASERTVAGATRAVSAHHE